MKQKQKYDTSVVFLYGIGKENLLPHDLRKQIPDSTIYNWRNADYSKYIGHEFRYYFEDAFDKAELLIENEQLSKTIMGFDKLWDILSGSLHSYVKKAGKDKEMKKKILNAIKFMEENIGLEKTLTLLGLSRTLYQQWILETRFACSDSFTSLCVKRHPHQLALKEVEKIKQMLSDPDYDHWPIVSIASLALRNKNVIACLYSWYKYAHLFGITKKLVKKDKKRIGLVSTIPNAYLHVDSTHYQLNDEQKVWISFVMDNYSKRILGFAVAERNNFKIVKLALTKALEVIMTHPDQQHSFLVTDGGKENHNNEIDQFIEDLIGHKLSKIRALKDIQFSNSPVEAIHKTMKGRYLQKRQFESIDAIVKFLDWAVMDYNILRPHNKHKPRTPDEVYFNRPLDFDIRKRVKDAIKKRVEINKCSNCKDCAGFCERKLLLD